jgi:hypothetical protein
MNEKECLAYLGIIDMELFPVYCVIAALASPVSFMVS